MKDTTPSDTGITRESAPGKSEYFTVRVRVRVRVSRNGFAR